MGELGRMNMQLDEVDNASSSRCGGDAVGRTHVITDRCVDDDYQLLDKIGEGQYAEVWRGERDGREYAIKLINKGASGMMKGIDKEIEIMLHVQNEDCVKLHAVYETNVEVQLVMELLAGNDLFDRIFNSERYSEGDAKKLIKKICMGVKQLHDKNCIHRDLKPENILLVSPDDNCNAKVADFGLSRLFPEGSARQQQAGTLCGTPGYVAPEVLERVPYSYAVDVWSLGVITYITVCGFPPFPLNMERASVKKVMRADFSFPSPYWDENTEECKDFIRQMLVLKPAERATMEQVLSHPWLADD